MILDTKTQEQFVVEDQDEDFVSNERPTTSCNNEDSRPTSNFTTHINTEEEKLKASSFARPIQVLHLMKLFFTSKDARGKEISSGFQKR